MNRRDFYRQGEPLGDCVTLPKTGGGYVCGGGGGGKSSSSSSSTTTTNNIDRRQVVAEGGIGLASDGATINVETIDAGIVKAALETVRADDATNGAGFTQLLTLADKLFSGAGEVINKTQDTALGQIAALNTVANDAEGRIDQKTIIIGGAVALGALYILKKKG